MRTLDVLEVERRGEHVIVIAEARSFLHHQVRNMVGSLKMVGEGKWPESAMAAVLAAKSRAAAGPTAPPDGLYFTRIVYDPPLEFPAG
jgi:tRNA pseudouridine38-40 synthase